MGSFSIDTSNFESVLVMEKKLKGAVFATMKFHAPKAESWMKQNAPWTDRTTNARNGLGAKAHRKGNLFNIVLWHSADYGIYLEDGTRNMRARPIIRPAIAYFTPRVQGTLTKILDRL